MTDHSHPHPIKGSEKEILTEAECAELLSVRRGKLWRLRRDERLPFITIGDGLRPRIRYLRAAVMTWLEARQKPQEPPARKRGRPRNVDRASHRRDGGRSA